MALLDPEKKKLGPENPREKLGLEDAPASRPSTNRVGKMVEGTTLGTPKSPMTEVDNAAVGVETPGVKKPKVKKKEIGVGAYQA